MQKELMNYDFHEIYRTHAQRVRSILFRFDQRVDVDDLVQEVFLKIWKKYDQFEQQSLLSTWIYRITINTALDSLRKRKISSMFKFSLLENEGTSEEKDRENRDLIQKIFSLMKADQRMLLVLFYYEGFSLSELSQIMGIAEGTIKSRLFNAKKIFLHYLKKEGVDYDGQ